jgi:hypothetical protein
MSLARRSFLNVAGVLAAAAVELGTNAVISAAGAHPFPVIGPAWLHLVAFWAGGYAGGRISGRAWPAVLPAACLAAGLVAEDLLVDPGVSVSTVAFVALALWLNVWTARRAARAARGRWEASGQQPDRRSP